jgi:hypothetical protein
VAVVVVHCCRGRVGGDGGGCGWLIRCGSCHWLVLDHAAWPERWW